MKPELPRDIRRKLNRLEKKIHASKPDSERVILLREYISYANQYKLEEYDGAEKYITFRDDYNTEIRNWEEKVE